jgi:peptide/nickel transport system substrate-binding protein
MKRHVTTIALVTLVALVLAACAQSAPTQQPAAQQQPAQQAPAQQAPAQQPAPQQPAQQAPAQQPAQPAAPAAKPVETKRGGQFVDASFADGATMQPILSQDTASGAYIALTYASLTRSDPDTLETIGNLYDGKGQLSSDGATLTWKLRPNLKWSDGQALTAKDVEFTWSKMMDEKVKFPYRQLYQDAFTSVTAKDDMTVEYKLKTPGFCPALINSGLVAPIPQHVFKDLDINQNDANNKPSIVSGIFRLKEWNKRQRHLQPGV